MEWTEKDKERLIALKNSVDSDDIKVKEQIKQILMENRYIAHVLNWDDLEEDCEIEDYFGEAILPYYMVPDTQTQDRNYLCYEVSYNEVGRYNNTKKVLQIIFYILVHQHDAIDRETGIARHDLLAALVQDEFNFTTRIGGGRLILVENKPSLTDTKYCTRTLVFEQVTDNNLVKTKNGIPAIINKQVQSHV